MKPMINIFFLFFTCTAFAKVEVVKTIEYQQIFAKINDLGQKHGAENILVVFDVDDTLLVIDQCLVNGEMTKGISKLFNCPSEPTEKDLPEKIEKIQSKGFNTLAITARGTSMIKATQRELIRQNIDFLGSPYLENQTILKPKKRCSKRETAPCYTKLRFTNGVMYANGSQKGWMLKTLLEYLGDDYKYIVFIDDRKKNIDAVNEVYGNIPGIDMNLFLYLRHRD